MSEDDETVLGLSLIFGAVVVVLACSVAIFNEVAPTLKKAAHEKNCDLFRVSAKGQESELKARNITPKGQNIITIKGPDGKPCAFQR